MPTGVYVRTAEHNRNLSKAWKDPEIRKRRLEALNTPKAMRNKSEAVKRYDYDGFRGEFHDLVRETVFEMLGDRCIECGRDMRVNIPIPHHVDPETKIFGILNEFHKYSWGEIVEEIEKCELRCIGCHSRIHRQELKKS